MATWRVARSLDTLLGQLNSLAPKRSKLSDGSIGDAAHATRSSDHNPYIKLAGMGIVRARDFTHDPSRGLDCSWLAKALASSGDPRIRYIIWNRRIWTPGVGWKSYTGTNPHDKHLHLSVSEQPGWFDSTLPWSLGVGADNSGPAVSPIDYLPPVPAKPEGFLMALNDAQQAELYNLIVQRLSQPIPNQVLDALVDGAGGGQALWANVSQIRADLGAILGALAARPTEVTGISRDELTQAIADAVPTDIAGDVASRLRVVAA